MITKESDLPITRQCELLSLNRSTVYYCHKEEPEADLKLMRRIDEMYLKRPFYGSRRIRDWLQDEGYEVNRKRVQRLMRQMGITAIYPKRRTSKPGKEHKIYPYLLRNLVIDRPNQVWATDISYIPMAKGFVYLVAVMDWHSRKVLSWRLSNSMDSDFCVEALEDALSRYGSPDIFNTDQGAQFTSEAFTDVLQEAGINISMDGKGRWIDNVFIERLWRSVKYEEVYLKAYETVVEARTGIGTYFQFYNSERRHQSMNRHTPDQVYMDNVEWPQVA